MKKGAEEMCISILKWFLIKDLELMSCIIIDKLHAVTHYGYSFIKRRDNYVLSISL